MTWKELLGDPTVRAALWQAWQDSEPGIVGGHEEGGFLCQGHDGDISVDRWPAGTRKEIYAPPHPRGRRNNEVIVATFHTHPNTGRSFDQEPSRQDCELVLQDPDLKHSEYRGEFVVSQVDLYFILPTGAWIVADKTEALRREENNDQ